MTCRELIDFLMDYLEAGLPAAERRRFDEHLAICPACRAYLRNYERTIKAGKVAFATAEEEIPASVPDELVKAIVAARRTL
jgi:anti-sigma factor RsiW